MWPWSFTRSVITTYWREIIKQRFTGELLSFYKTYRVQSHHHQIWLWKNLDESISNTKDVLVLMRCNCWNGSSAMHCSCGYGIMKCTCHCQTCKTMVNLAGRTIQFDHSSTSNVAGNIDRFHRGSETGHSNDEGMSCSQCYWNLQKL